MYFSVFLGQKHAAYCEFYLSLCTYGNMIQYAVQLFWFSGDFSKDPFPFSDGCLNISHFATVELEPEKNVGINISDKKDLISEVVLTFFKAYTQLW